MFLFTKYIVAAGMILLIISHGIVQFGLFEVIQMNHKTVIKKQLNNDIPQDQKVIFKFGKSEYQVASSGIDWKDKDEFRFDGRMYDIISTEETEDSVYIHCILDSNESDLYSILDKLIEDDSENSDHENGLNNYFSHFYSYTENQNSFKSFYSDNQYFVFTSAGLLYSEIPVATPPPQA